MVEKQWKSCADQMQEHTTIITWHGNTTRTKQHQTTKQNKSNKNKRKATQPGTSERRKLEAVEIQPQYNWNKGWSALNAESKPAIQNFKGHTIKGPVMWKHILQNMQKCSRQTRKTADVNSCDTGICRLGMIIRFSYHKLLQRCYGSTCKKLPLGIFGDRARNGALIPSSHYNDGSTVAGKLTLIRVGVRSAESAQWNPMWETMRNSGQLVNTCKLYLSVAQVVSACFVQSQFSRIRPPQQRFRQDTSMIIPLRNQLVTTTNMPPNRGHYGQRHSAGYKG